MLAGNIHAEASNPALSLNQVEEAILGGTTARRGEAVIARGEGCCLWDTDGRRYLDLTSAQGVAMLGHCHPALTPAIAAQAHTLISCPTSSTTTCAPASPPSWSKCCRRYLQHVFLANSGAEAIDGALKFARLVTGRTRYIAFRSSFHGRTVGAVSLTWEKKYREPFLPLLDVVHLPYNKLDALETALDDQIAAVVVEIVQGEGGVNLGDGRVSRRRAAPVPRARRPADRRRNPDRLWAHRQVVWLPAL